MLTEARTHMKVKHLLSGRYLCNMCGKSYPKRSLLQSHVTKIHERSFVYKCTSCTFTSTSKTSYMHHGRDVHQNLKKKCKICGKILASDVTFSKHMHMHNNVKPYKCSHCSRSFIQKITCQIHELTHTGVKHFQCPACSMAYSQPYPLKQHVKKHHPDLNYTVRYSVNHVKSLPTTAGNCKTSTPT